MCVLVYNMNHPTSDEYSNLLDEIRYSLRSYLKQTLLYLRLCHYVDKVIRVGRGDLNALRLRPDATSHFLNLSAASGRVASTCQQASLATYWNVFTSLSIPSLLAKNTTSLSTVSKDISYGAGRRGREREKNKR